VAKRSEPGCTSTHVIAQLSACRTQDGFNIAAMAPAQHKMRRRGARRARAGGVSIIARAWEEDKRKKMRKSLTVWASTPFR
jgi:hypothetical protein